MLVNRFSKTSGLIHILLETLLNTETKQFKEYSAKCNVFIVYVTCLQ